MRTSGVRMSGLRSSRPAFGPFLGYWWIFQSMLGDSTRLLARRGVHRWCLIPPSLPVVVSVCWRAFQPLKFLSQFLFHGTSKNAVERVEDQLQTQQVLDQASVLVPNLDAKAGSLNTSNRKANLEVLK